jgi:hypothetical protein
LIYLIHQILHIGKHLLESCIYAHWYCHEYQCDRSTNDEGKCEDAKYHSTPQCGYHVQ